MEEIRCPMCGRMNPPELDVCQYCQARLKPLVISQPPVEDVPGKPVETSPSAEGDESVPDWLEDLRPQDDRLPDQEETGLEDEVPPEEAGAEDWLDRLQDRAFVEGGNEAEEESEEVPFQEQDDLLDRLSAFEPYGESEARQDKVPSAGSDQDAIWTSDAEPSSEDALPEWLSEISPESTSQEHGEEEIELPGVEAESQGEEQLPDWLSEIEPAEAEELPAWLAEANIEASSIETPLTDEETTPEDGPEEGEEGTEEEYERLGEEAGPEEIPAWLKELKEEQAGPVPSLEEAEIEAKEPSLEKGELPEWLVDLQAVGSDQEGAGEELPDWLAQGEQETPPEADAEAELPDWLATIGAQEAEEEPETEETPEWLSSLQAEEAEETADSTLGEAEIGIEPDKAPDWLSELEKEFSSEALSPEPAEESVPPFTFDGEGLEDIEEVTDLPVVEAAEVLEQEETPEWLAELEKEFSSQPVSPEPAEEDTAAFLVDEEGLELDAPEAPPSMDAESAEFLEALPDWAAEVPSEEVEGVEEGLELEGAELPSWLEAMRPVESVDLDIVEEGEEAAEGVETSGPLAGLSGILAAQSDFARVRKPPAYSVKLHVTEAQEARVAMLRELLEAEDKQKPLPAKPILTPQYIFRLVISLALIIPIAWAVISGGGLTPLPDPANVPAGVLDMRRQIDSQLSANSPVLVAFDYEAGFSSELDIPSRAVISHLMNKGAFLTLVSTTPGGPLLAERLIDSMNQTSTRQGNPFTTYANFGYIPGGAAGLLSLAQSPQQTIPSTLENVILWEDDPLNAVESVGDFSMVLVITENPDTARAWIEQVQPFLRANETPLLMVVSAQAEPLVQPYYQGSSGQVQGLVVGFAGGVVYDSMTGQDVLSRGSWDAFSLGMSITVIILILGIFVGLGSGLLAPDKKGEV